VDEDKYMENSIGVQVKVLDTIIVKKTFEEVACRKSQPVLHESGEHRVLVRIFLHRIWISRGGTPHIHLLLVEETAVHQRQKVFGLHFGFFFHSLFGFGRGGDAGGVDPSADPAASSRDLFFPAAVFILFDGDGFILQRQRVFTRIRSGAAAEADGGGARGFAVYSVVAGCTDG
jgi:hypothetical protein